MRIMKDVGQWISRQIERMQGSVNVSEGPITFLGSVTALSTTGYRIDIFCEKRTFLIESSGVMEQKLLKHVFFVNAVPSVEAPKVLHDACRASLPIPSIIAESSDDDAHLEACVNAYLDVLNRRLQGITRVAV